MEEPTTNPDNEPRQERLPLTWDSPSTPSTVSAAPVAAQPVYAEPAKPAITTPLTPKVSPFRTPQACVRPTPEQPASIPSAPQPGTATPFTGMAVPPQATGRLRVIGRSLRTARESRQYSIAQVSQKTKIPREFIENIENAAAANLPQPVYAKSYIRQLCREYDLDATPLLEEYRQSLESAPEATEKNSSDSMRSDKQTGLREGAPRQSHPTTPEKPNMSTSSSPTKLIVIIVVVGLVFAAVLVAIKGKKSPESSATPGAQIDTTQFIAPQTLPTKELPVQTSPAPVAPVTTAP